MLQIRLLGQFDIRAAGKRVVIPTRAGQSLVARLVLTAGTAHRREQIAGLFWPDTSDENARRNLRQELWRIRKAFAAQLTGQNDYLLADEYTLTFNREADYWLDVAQLEKPNSDIQALTSNLAVYQGELLPGFYDDWITLERERIQSIFETKMSQLLDQLVAAERWLAVQEWGERWLSLSSTPEPAYRALMLAHGVRGDMAKVAALYQRCIAELREKLDVDPSAETRALYEGLVKGAKAPLRTATVQAFGTVTFLFTDIEGSTRLLDQQQDQYAALLAEHHAILRSAIQKWNGHEEDTQGDAFFVTFARALDAVQCVAEAQRALTAHAWLHAEPVKVRMGLHTGEPLIASTGYVGMDVHRAARIGDAAHGGQVLLSHTTRELVANELPPGLALRNLGEQRLKDMKYPTYVYQLVIDGLPNEFPPLRTKFSTTEAPTPGEPPYKGLQYFDETDSDLFFGREVLTEKLVNRLLPSPSSEPGLPAPQAERSGARFLSVIIGASGSGKSSLVRAGLVPALKKRNADWQVYVITPTAHPLQSLAAELTRDSESVSATATLIDDLAQDPRSLSLYLARQNSKRHVLLVIDQSEEMFTLCRDDFEREAFIDNLLTTLTPGPAPDSPPTAGGTFRDDGRVTLVLTLRADFYAHLAQYPELREAVAQQQEYIGPMTTEELRRAIEEPAKRGHWQFEPGLIDLILRDVGDEPGALPLLSHALLETWKRRAGYLLTLKGYDDAGGVRGAIAHTAEDVYQHLSRTDQTIARNIFLRLTELGEGTEDTRRRAQLAELTSQTDEVDQVRAVLNTLAQARLVTLSENTAEVAHEALIREWPSLREWLNQNRDGLRLQRNLTEAAQEWELLERDSGVLYRGSRLSQAYEWSALHPKALNAQEQLFLDASMNLEQQEQDEREQQQQRELEAARKLAETQSRHAKQLQRRAFFLTGAFVLAIVLAAVALFFGQQSNQNAAKAGQNAQAALQAQATAVANAAAAQQSKEDANTQRDAAVQSQAEALLQQRVATSRELAASAISNLDVDPERSILLALQAVTQTYAIDHSVLPEAEDALHRAVQASSVELTLRDHSGDIRRAVFSPDGTRLATASADGTAKIWDATSGQDLLTLQASAVGWVDSVAFSPNGKLFATAGDDKTARIWDSVTGKQLLSLKGHADWVSEVAFSPDGSWLASSSADGTIKLWDVLTGKEISTLHEEAGAQINAMAFSPDGSQIATAVATNSGSYAGWASIWSVRSGQILLTLRGHETGVENVAFSPDGLHIVTTGDDSTAKIWDAHTGAQLLTLYGHTDIVWGAAFSPDGARLATVSGDRQIKIWDARTGRELFSLAGHTQEIRSVAFSPDGTRIVTASADKTAKVWSVAPSREFLTLVNGPAIEFIEGTELAYSPDGTHLATASSDLIPKIWDVATGKLLLQLIGHTGLVTNIAYSSDGTRIATASNDDTAKIWDAVTGKELLTLAGHKEWVSAVAFSPDGSRLATGSFDGTIKTWNALTGANLNTFTGPKGRVFSIDYSPDGTRLATSNFEGTGAANVWDAASGQELLALTNHTNLIQQVVFSPDGARLATASFDGTAKVWDAVTGKELFTLAGHSGTLFDVKFSRDGRYLATVSVDKTAKIWDALTGKELLTLHAPASLTGVAFSPDSSQLAVGSRDGTTRIYLLHIADLITLAKSRLTRTLTSAECEQYLHRAQCPVTP